MAGREMGLQHTSLSSSSWIWNGAGGQWRRGEMSLEHVAWSPVEESSWASNSEIKCLAETDSTLPNFKSVQNVLEQWFSNVVPGPATLAFTRSLLETASGHLPRPADSETLGMSSRNLSYNKSSRWFWGKFKHEDCWSRARNIFYSYFKIRHLK